jgi:putative Ca2+/H+ antiporter (TMEM165/GDT1 family)
VIGGTNLLPSVSASGYTRPGRESSPGFIAINKLVDGSIDFPWGAMRLDWKVMLSTFGLIFVAERGYKTQFPE